MRTSRLLPLLLALFCSLTPASIFAQQITSTSVATPTSDPRAVTVVLRALTALVGSTDVNDVTLTGTANRIAGSDNESGTAKLQAMVGGYSQLSLDLPSGNRIETRNPAGIPLADSLPPGTPTSAAQAVQPVGAWSGPDGVAHGMANHNVMTDATWFFPAFTVGDLVSSQACALSYIGQETHDGQPVVHVQISQPLPAAVNAPQPVATLMLHLSQMDLYLDSTTLLPVALSFNVHPDNNPGLDIPTEIQFSNYQLVNGVEVPFHVQKYLNNGLVLDLQYHNAALNSGLTAAAFDIR
jgi:hypothetical protein